MGKLVKTAFGVGISLVLASTLALAAGNGQSAKKDANGSKEHHSRFAKAAFWRHHKNQDSKQAKSKPARTEVAQVKSRPGAAASKSNRSTRQHASSVQKPVVKNARARKPASSKATAKRHTASAHTAVKRHSAAKKTTAKRTKPQGKAQPRTTASLQ